MRISDWSSDVCSSDLGDILQVDAAEARLEQFDRVDEGLRVLGLDLEVDRVDVGEALEQHRLAFHHRLGGERPQIRSEEHTSELQSLMRISYAVFCLKKKTNNQLL